MKTKEFQKLVNEALSDGDFALGLTLSATRYKDTVQYLSKKERIVTLRLIRGFATQIMNNELHTDAKRESSEIRSCDYCWRNAEDARLLQGHNGAICEVCIKSLFEEVDS